jgi:cytochrome d ubiquinol oxidase subunit I
VRKGPKIDEGKETNEGGPGQKRTPARPLSAADDDGTEADNSSSLTKEI